MKKLFLLFIAFLCLKITSYAQEGWFWQNPLPHGHTYTDVHVFDVNNAIAVGENMITKTTNGGDSWSFYPLERYIYFTSVHFIDNHTGWAVGNGTFPYRPTIFKTTNQGEDWIVIKCDTNNTGYFTSIIFVDENVGWLTRCGETGCRLEKTTDGGLNWFFQHTGFSPNSMFFFDGINGWLGGEYEDSILMTTDGGDTWSGSYIEPWYSIKSICFSDLDNGWAVGGHSVLRTTNGGLDWIEQIIDSTTNLRSVYFLDNFTGWAAGDEIFKTTNGGQDWFLQVSNNFNAIHFAEDNTGWAVGLYGNITKTMDGNSWIPYSSTATNALLFSTHFANEYTGWAVGSFGEIVKTIDGGNNWLPQTSGTSHFLHSVFFVDDQNGWAAGGNFDYYNNTGKILKTTNGGDNWITQSIPVDSVIFSSIYFADINIGWAVGGLSWDPGIIMKTINGGNHWIVQKTYPEKEFADVFFIDSNIGWVTGDSLYKTTNGGENWIGYEGWYDKIYFIDQVTGWAVNRYKIQKTTNGGEDWTIQYQTNSGFEFNDVCFVDENYGWAVGVNNTAGHGGLILFTTNGGENWLHQWSGTSNGLSSIYFTDNNNGWIVGEGGTILHTTNSGVSFVEESEIDEIPNEYLLSNNYPNPFNPNTKIKYSVPQSTSVVIKVFDILGNEIETLMNEEKPAGTYEITWYAEGLPSGVYFYQLNAGTFVETKKMILLK